MDTDELIRFLQRIALASFLTGAAFATIHWLTGDKERAGTIAIILYLLAMIPAWVLPHPTETTKTKEANDDGQAQDNDVH